ncbi:uncharacterized protein LOC116777422 [Danaus plexippus]|uniref:Uncharacterized protein n=1 Tax=Danaus plexippus plexippus TaxID=278856 RepID=A0A212FJ26_DANPL|nr:uncharacterized protein LOC116777422 [Danaus plexippus]OWR53731.1 hypothetical protein KGM_201791 [Danaus plexippus plexippus]
MSDSSEDEDLSRFKEAVDISFLNIINKTWIELKNHIKNDKPSDVRYLDESAHYNDVKVPEELQKRVGNRVSAIINKQQKFVDVLSDNTRKEIMDSCVKLFNNSEQFLASVDAEDTYTALHNIRYKKIKKEMRKHDLCEHLDPSESDKFKMAVLSGEYVLSKADTKMWKSRRKEKLFRYRSDGKSNVVTAIE